MTAKVAETRALVLHLSLQFALPEGPDPVTQASLANQGLWVDSLFKSAHEREEQGSLRPPDSFRCAPVVESVGCVYSALSTGHVSAPRAGGG